MFRTEELSEICRVSFQNKFEKLVRLVGFIGRTAVAQWLRYCATNRKVAGSIAAMYRE
jgi:hypothetical protein